MEITFGSSVILAAFLLIIIFAGMLIFAFNDYIYDDCFFNITSEERKSALIFFIIIGGVGSIFLPVEWFEKLSSEWFEWLPAELKNISNALIYPSEYNLKNDFYEISTIAILRFIAGAVTIGIVFGLLFFFLFGIIGAVAAVWALGSVIYIVFWLFENISTK